MKTNRVDLNPLLLNSSNSSLYQNACRTCLKLLEGDRNKIFIFQQNINRDIGSLISINLQEGDGLPDFICDRCYEKLNSAVEFKNRAETVNAVLEQYIKNLSEVENGSIFEVVKNQLKHSTTVKSYENNSESEEDNLKSDASASPINDEALTTENKDQTMLSKLSNMVQTSGKKQKKSVECPTCSKEFKTASSVKAHLRSHGIIEKKLECSKCGKKYTNQYDLRVHLRKHTGVRPYSCKVCKKSFADERCFEKHKKIHSGEKLFRCQVCDKSFIHSYTLKTHLRVHSGEKPFVCARCGHSFATSTQLKLHTRIHHTQEKPYSCDICPKVFACSSGLSNHKMTHTGERKFICSVCGKGSRTTSDLKCHLRTHTGERPFKCTFPDCDKRYKTNSQLCTHIRTHTGEKNHKCTICFKFFCNSVQLKSHLCT